MDATPTPVVLLVSGVISPVANLPSISPEIDEYDMYHDAEKPSRRTRKLKTVYFRFGSRIIAATGTQSDREHPNVLRLTVYATALDRIVRTLLYLFPSALRSWVQGSFPEWALPTNIVLKKEKDDWEEEFDTEKATYEKLRCFQGHVIPICYGQIEYDGARALILSDIGGACLAEPEGVVLHEKELRPLLDQALSALASCGISHDDIKLDNFHLVGQDHNWIIMVVVLERVDELSKEELDWVVPNNVDRLINAYRDHLDCLRFDGLLPRDHLDRLQEGLPPRRSHHHQAGGGGKPSARRES
ncbi:Uncharacterized protein TCAP_07277 [Tolypocladium capitatum]|uniref:Protein kinase domain-containing protein n=1 Tax=Tolypocladium capitatum TaxID=45235 RepID=A0A2K3Q163_9HYPO|nr:Uncharacterized protein TCAP_07277 [Tolypocladium capitatum]